MPLKLINGKFEEIDLDEYNQKIKLSFLDPPDNVGMKYENYNDKISPSLYYEFLSCWIKKACDITDGPVFISFAEKYIDIVEKIIERKDIKLIQRLYWFYTFGQNNKNRYTPCIRPIYWLNKDIIYPENIKIPSERQKKYNDKRAAKNGRLPYNIWEFPRICGTFSEKRKWHCTQHPEALIERIILGHSKENDLILDPMIGSGTSAYVCKKTNRDCIGIDVSQFYLDNIRREYDARPTK